MGLHISFFFSFACLSSLLSFVQDRFSRPFFRELDLFFQKSGLDFSLGAGLAFSRQGLRSGVFLNAYNFMAQKSEKRVKSAFKKKLDYVFPIFVGTECRGKIFHALLLSFFPPLLPRVRDARLIKALSAQGSGEKNATNFPTLLT